VSSAKQEEPNELEALRAVVFKLEGKVTILINLVQWLGLVLSLAILSIGVYIYVTR
jgi:hypothetical protein